MSELDDLLAACIAAPDDDEPRLVWADAVGGARGELVVIQCKLAREDLPPAEAGALIARVEELLAANGAAWSGFADNNAAVKRVLYRRGFVESIEADITLVPWTTLLERAPLANALDIQGIEQHVDHRQGPEPTGRDPIAILADVFAHPMLARLKAIGIKDAYLYEYMGGDEWDNEFTSRAGLVCELIARTGRLAGMRSFALRDMFDERGIYELLSSNLPASVERLAFDLGTAGPYARDLIAAMPNLQALDLGNQALPLRDIIDVLPPSFVELRGGILREPDVFEEFDARIAPQIVRDATGFARRYDRYTSLRTLDVRHTAISGPNQGDPNFERVPAFAATSLPALRELHVFADLRPQDLMLIADAFGPQLAVFDLTGTPHVVTPELRAKVAGHIRVGGYRKSEAFLEANTNTREPGLGYGVVTLRA